ncbi:ABC transporter substrate-binding protein [Desulfobotulus sp.]|uniref:ABC transporter substrate-binding protein n=1 Tax=Desulfobotulus sp. TaxID=1940337 RepID=UPI002A35A29F|nr:ABC transporter substrate-binding protein [Desulfobotulus sp.]MDY0164191.1 ABC transporter substrate-binding protein [Desulfobotulus sp.]
MVKWARAACSIVLGLVMAGSALAAAPKKVEVTFWHAMGGGNIAFIERMVADFNFTHPQIEVKAEYKGSYRDTLNATILAHRQKKSPHMVHIFEVGTQMALDSGIFTPFAQGLEASALRDLEDYIPPVANYYTINGQFNSIPWNSSNPVLYYNKDIFRKAGLDPENPPKTYGEIMKAAEQIVRSKAAVKGITWPLHSWFVEQWISMQGALLANNENGRAGRATETHLDSPAMMRTATWWKELYDKGLYAYSGKPEDWDGANKLFVSGQTGMLITSTSDVTFHQAAAFENGYALGTGPLPAPDGMERNGVVVGGASIWMTRDKSPEEMEAARTFLLWLTNTENGVRWHKGTGYFPVRTSSCDVVKNQGWFEKNPAYTAAFEQLLSTRVNRASQGALLGPFPEIRTIITDAMQQILSGTPVEKALKEADTRADKALQDYNRSVK